MANLRYLITKRQKSELKSLYLEQAYDELTSPTPPASPKPTRDDRFNFDVKHIAGEPNVAADLLSRMETKKATVCKDIGSQNFIRTASYK